MSTEVIDSLLDKLDFTASEELTEASQAVLVGLLESETDPSRIQLVWTEYAKISEKIVEQSDDYMRAQIAAIIHKAGVFAKAGNPLRYIEELDRAEVYAYNSDLTDVSVAIQTEIEKVSEPLVLSPELLVVEVKGTVSEANREQLRDLISEGADLNDIVGNVYGMILEEGGDPDIELARLGITEIPE